jgi:Fe-S cluster assembly protein SufD
MAEQSTILASELAGGLAPGDALPGGALSWMAALRESSAARLRELALPGITQESWKYTNLRRALDGLQASGDPALRRAVSLDHAPSLLADRAAARLVFVNGLYRAELSDRGALPSGVELLPLSEALAAGPLWLGDQLGRIVAGDEQALLTLNTALTDDGLVLRLADGVALDRPVEVVFVGGLAEQAVAYHPRLLVVLGAKSRLRLVEHHLGLGETPTLSNLASEISLGPGAALSHVKLQAENAASLHLATTHVRLAENAAYDGFALTTGAKLSRHEIRLSLAGEGADARVNGAYLLRGTQHGDTTTEIVHAVPGTTCREVYKGALDEAARAVFQGKIVVERDAQKSDGRMLNKTLLLSDKAEIDSKPELEIFADDVQCAHGSTAGELDDLALFYLRSRGIPEHQARSLLVEAFLTEAVEELGDAELRPILLAAMQDWLART